VTGRRYGTRVEADDDRWEIDLVHGSCELEIELEGEIRFSPDDRGIEWLGRGAELTIEEDAEVDRELVVTPGPGGEPRYRWSVGGEERPFDQAARRWLAEVLPEVFRSTGLQAPERVARFLAAGGVPAVLAEIRQMSSDHVQGFYFDETLRQHRLTAAEARDLLETAGETLGSDYEHARTLRAVVDRDRLDDATVAALLRSAGSIGSDHELAELLVHLAGRAEIDGPLRERYLETAQEVGSRYERERVLAAVGEAVGSSR
jgi:hypothetical protein